MNARQPMRPGVRKAFVKGVIAGYRGTCDWRESCAVGWDFRQGWLDGKRLRVLNPYGVACWLRDVGWFGYRFLDRPESGRTHREPKATASD